MWLEGTSEALGGRLGGGGDVPETMSRAVILFKQNQYFNEMRTFKALGIARSFQEEV